VNGRDYVSNWTPLMRVAAVSGSAEMASLLLQQGASINLSDKNGQTALMTAALNGHEELV
jgi:ankyrin repeat protein